MDLPRTTKRPHIARCAASGLWGVLRGGMKVDRYSPVCHSNCATYHAIGMGRSPCLMAGRKHGRARRKWRSGGQWLQVLRREVAKYSDPSTKEAFAECVRRLPSLGRVDNAGEYGRLVLGRVLSGDLAWAEEPRTKRWFQRMFAVGIVATVDRYPGAPWCLHPDIAALLKPQD